MEGWVKLHRRIVESPDYFAEPFTRTQAWIDLILLANFDDSYIRIKGVRVKVQRGEIITSSVALAKRWMWSRGKVLRFLDELETVQQIVQVRTAVYTSISIINYGRYQADGTSDSTSDSTGDGTSPDTSKECIKNDKKIIHTHTVDTDKGGVGGSEEAEALVEWLRREHPSLADKARPLTVQQAEWLLHKHTAATLRRIISQVADNPKTSEKEDVYCRIVTFLRWDKQTEPQKKQFTYEEVCNELSKGATFESFEVVRSAEGKALYWVRKEAVTN